MPTLAPPARRAEHGAGARPVPGRCQASPRPGQGSGSPLRPRPLSGASGRLTGHRDGRSPASVGRGRGLAPSRLAGAPAPPPPGAAPAAFEAGGRGAARAGGTAHGTAGPAVCPRDPAAETPPGGVRMTPEQPPPPPAPPPQRHRAARTRPSPVPAPPPQTPAAAPRAASPAEGPAAAPGTPARGSHGRGDPPPTPPALPPPPAPPGGRQRRPRRSPAAARSRGSRGNRSRSMALPALPRRRQEAPARPRCGGAEAPGSRSPRPGPAPPPPPPPPPPPAASAGPRGAAAPGGRRAGQGSPTRELGSRARGGGAELGLRDPRRGGVGGARPGPRPRPHRASGRPRGVRTPHRARAARPCRCPGTARALLRGGGTRLLTPPTQTGLSQRSRR